MSFLNSIVDKVYVINLKKDTKKLKSVTKELDDQHIVFERFDGIDGSSMKSDSRLTQSCNSYCGYGIKGCALSHRTIWENALKKGYEAIAIFEDDIVFNEKFNTTLQLNYYSIPNDFDIIYLGSAFDCGDTSTYNTIRENLNSIKNQRINKDLLKVSGCGGTYAYIISKKCMERFVKEQINFHIDQQIVKIIKKNKLKAYAFQPVIIEPYIHESNLNSSFPPILNFILSYVKLTNQKNAISLNWLINETAYQYGKLKLCFLMLAIFLICFLVPIKYYYTLYIWLIIEFLASFDFNNTLIYGIIISIPFFIKQY
jgi:hypothetical protein